jgi:apolipoprotein N-acyltransferase
MNSPGHTSDSMTRLDVKSQFAFVLVAGVAFHIAFANEVFSPLILVYLGCLVELTRARTGRLAFYSGLLLGLLVFAPKLAFFFTIFSFAAVPLWLILALWHALFVYLGQRARANLPAPAALALIPIFWTGLEYFRSELYPLKFSWLSPAYAFGPNGALSIFGAFGITLVLLFVLAGISQLPRKPRLFASVTVFALACGVALPSRPQAQNAAGKTLRLAGMQLEFPVELEVPGKLDLLKQKYPEADIYVLSEYTFDGPVPKPVRAWCKRNSKYLIVGGKDPAANGNFYNTAFVIGPSGEIVFKQAKAVPIQFFKDGLPAPEQKVWESPWGKIGLCVCYDLSYTRVIDVLVKQGAQVIINPTMDVADWGRAQHELHARVPPMRAAEYGIPIFRVASSGVSEAVDALGRVAASAPFPGEQAVVFAEMSLAPRARLPIDRFFAPVATGVTALFMLWLVTRWCRIVNARRVSMRIEGNQPMVA